ncbi:hypothetical protein AHAS_Ahas09G0298700 [Arachis hypogaea]
MIIDVALVLMEEVDELITNVMISVILLGIATVLAMVVAAAVHAIIAADSDT